MTRKEMRILMADIKRDYEEALNEREKYVKLKKDGLARHYGGKAIAYDLVLSRFRSCKLTPYVYGEEAIK